MNLYMYILNLNILSDSIVDCLWQNITVLDLLSINSLFLITQLDVKFRSQLTLLKSD